MYDGPKFVQFHLVFYSVDQSICLRKFGYVVYLKGVWLRLKILKHPGFSAVAYIRVLDVKIKGYNLDFQYVVEFRVEE